MTIVSALIGAAGRISARWQSGKTLDHIGAWVANTTADPLKRELQYHVNYVAPNVVPEPAALIQAYHSRRLNGNMLKTLLGYHGVKYIPNLGRDTSTFTQRAWYELVELAQPTFDLSTAVDLWRQGYIDDNELSDRMVRIGHYDHDIELQKTQYGVPSAADGLQFWQQGWITDPQFSYLLDRAGINRPDFQRLYFEQRKPVELGKAVQQFWLGEFDLEATTWHLRQHGYSQEKERDTVLDLQAPLTPIEAAGLYYRGHITVVELDRHLKANGMVNDKWREDWIKGTRWLPTPPDLISFAVREVWDEETVAAFGYDEEFPEPFRYWMAAQGADWGEPVPNPAGPDFPAVSWPVAAWRAHWQAMSPTMAYDAQHRLRPGRTERFAGLVPGIKPFTVEDTARILKIADYPVVHRQWLTALAYQPLRLVDIRQAYSLGVRGRDWAIEQMRDRGLLPDDAATVVDLMEMQLQEKDKSAVRSLEKRSRGMLAKALMDGFADGIVNEQDFRNGLFALGVRLQYIDRLVAAITAQQRVVYIRELKAALKRDFAQGVMTPAEAGNHLVALGVSPLAASQTVQLWRLRGSLERKMATTSQLLGFLKQGLMTEADVLQRLLNLGWYQPDALVAVAAAVNALRVSQGKAVQAAAKASAKNAADLQKAVNAQKAALRQAQRDLRRMTPVTTVGRWFKDGIVSETWVRSRLAAMGYAADAINGYVTEWALEAAQDAAKKQAAAEKAAKTQPPTASAPSQGGTGSAGG